MTVFLPHTVTLSNQPKNLSVIVYDELRDHVESLFESVPENLTPHRLEKNIPKMWDLLGVSRF